MFHVPMRLPKDICISVSSGAAYSLMRSMDSLSHDSPEIAQVLLCAIGESSDTSSMVYEQHDSGGVDEDTDPVVVFLCPGNPPEVMTGVRVL